MLISTAELVDSVSSARSRQEGGTRLACLGMRADDAARLARLRERNEQLENEFLSRQHKVCASFQTRVRSSTPRGPLILKRVVIAGAGIRGQAAVESG